MNEKLELIIQAIAEKGYSVVPHFLDSTAAEKLALELELLKSEGRFYRAGVGRGSEHIKTNEIRRDEICWFEPSQLLPGQMTFWNHLLELKERLNETFFLGLWDLEGHFAVYEPGGFYKRHLDRFKSDDARTISVVLYLNDRWEKGHGGELAIYRTPSDSEPIIIEPRMGTLVCFLSDRIEHEVCESHRERKSFAGWFRRR